MTHFRNYFIISLFSIVIVIVLYHFYRKGYESYYAFEHGHLNEIIRGKEDYDILFIGSSRTYYHVNPKIVDSITSLNSYNAGLAGANLFECNLVLQCYLQSHKAPKVVVLDIAKNAFEIKSRPIWNPTHYYYFLDNDIVFNALKPYEHVYLLKYLPFIRFIEADDMSKQNAFMGYFQRNSVENKEFYKGYFSFGSDTITLPFKRKYANVNYPVEPDGVESLMQIIKSCKKNNVKLVFTFAPVYDAKNEVINPNFFSEINKVCSEYNIPFWNFRNETQWNDHKLFVEELHLNPVGVNRYSAILADKINSYIRE